MLVLLALVSVSRIQIAAPVLKGDQWTGNDRKRADMSVCAFKAIDHIRSDRIKPLLNQNYVYSYFN